VWATLRASVLITEGRFAVWPIFSGHIDRGVSDIRAVGTSACARKSI